MSGVPGPLEVILILFVLSVFVAIGKIWHLCFKREDMSPLEAPGWLRLINFVIDVTLVNLLLLPISNVISDSLYFVVSLCLFFAYYFIFESLLQKTPAKFITRTKVVRSIESSNLDDVYIPSPSTIAKRTLIRAIPFEPLTGWWHDRWSKTWVVKDRG